MVKVKNSALQGAVPLQNLTEYGNLVCDGSGVKLGPFLIAIKTPRAATLGAFRLKIIDVIICKLMQYHHRTVVG